MELGWGGTSTVAEATGMSRVTMTAGITELKARQDFPAEVETTRVRRSGGGRQALTAADAELLQTSESLVDPVTRGDPMSPLRWTCKSTRKLSDELHRQKHPVGPRTVATLLRQAGYSLQANRKTREGNQHRDRNAQFEYIRVAAVPYRSAREPRASLGATQRGSGGHWFYDCLPSHLCDTKRVSSDRYNELADPARLITDRRSE